MASKSEDLLYFEADVSRLEKGQSLPIYGLQEAFEAETEDEAIEAAKAEDD